MRQAFWAAALLAIASLAGCTMMLRHYVQVRPGQQNGAALTVRPADLEAVQAVVREVAGRHGLKPLSELPLEGRTGPVYGNLDEDDRRPYASVQIQVVTPEPKDTAIVIELVQLGVSEQTSFGKRVESDLLRSLRASFGDENVVLHRH